MKGYTWIFLVVLGLLVSACTDSADARPPGDAEVGKNLFQQPASAAAPSCSSCHSIEPGRTLTGPSLEGVAERAAERVPGMTAEDYLRQSILEPDAYVVESFSPGVMYQDFGGVFSDEDIDNLVAYLLTLR